MKTGVSEVDDSIVGLEQSLLQNFDQSEGLPVEMYFIKGVCVRALYIPCGMILTGRIHNHECVNIVAKGKIAVASNEGNRTLEEGAIFVSPPGVKRAGFALKDTIYVTVHRTDTVDPEALIDELTSGSFEEYTKRIEGGI
jgi:hypothetical protein